MSDHPSGQEVNPFEVARIRQLVRLMRDNELTEIDLHWEQARIRLRRGTEGSPIVSAVPNPMPAVPPAANQEATSAAESETTSPPTAGHDITAPVPGTFYAAPSPDAEPFVTVGTRVNVSTTVCIIEAMKVFNDVPAGVSGTIAEVLVENGAAVEYGLPIFRVRLD